MEKGKWLWATRNTDSDWVVFWSCKTAPAKDLNNKWFAKGYENSMCYVRFKEATRIIVPTNKPIRFRLEVNETGGKK